MTSLNDYLTKAVNEGASDIHVTVGRPVVYRKTGKLINIDEQVVTPDVSKELVLSMLDKDQLLKLDELGEVDLSYSIPKVARFRVNAFMQRGTYSASVRVILTTPPDPMSLGLPKEIVELANLRSGLVLVTGPTGSGKSTTLASLINYINVNRNCKIITLEDPIEYLHPHKNCVVTQREVGADTKSYSNAIRAALRQDPDVILVGEMRDHETISIALTAAETGHLVFSTLHTIGAAKTVDRVTDIFEPFQQQQVKMQLSTILRAVISQQLLPKKDGKGRVAAFEIMLETPAISNNIRESKSFLINNVIQTSKAMGMITMDAYLVDLVFKDIVDYEVARSYAVNKEHFDKLVKGTA